MMIANVFSPP